MSFEHALPTLILHHLLHALLVGMETDFLRPMALFLSVGARHSCHYSHDDTSEEEKLSATFYCNFVDLRGYLP
jgi:hypothetical protein